MVAIVTALQATDTFVDLSPNIHAWLAATGAEAAIVAECTPPGCHGPVDIGTRKAGVDADLLDAVTEFTEEAKPELQIAAQNLRQSTETLVNVTEKVEQWLVENDAAVDSFLANGIGETAALMTDTRATMRELEKLGVELRGDPSRLIYKPKLDPVVVAK